MYLGEEDAKKLISLGFKRTYYVDEIAPFDIYKLNDDDWCVGGRIIPDEILLSPEEVYKNGLWLPNIYDLMLWLERNEFKYILSHNYEGLVYRIEVFDEDKNSLVKAKGGTVENVLFKVISKLLEMKM